MIPPDTSLQIFEVLCETEHIFSTGVSNISTSPDHFPRPRPATRRQ